MRLTITRKLSLMIVVAALLSVAALSLQLYSLNQTIWKDRKALIVSQVQTAISILDGFQKRVEAGEMSLEEAQARAKDATRAIRYGENDYVFMMSGDGTRVMHPDPKLQGTNSFESKDSTGLYYNRDMVENAHKGGGFTTYYRARLKGSDSESPKLSYAQLFQPWDWTVGGGLYVDDLQDQFMGEVYKTLGWLGLLLVALAACALPISRSITRPLHAMTASMRRLSGGDVAAEIPGIGRRDEIGEIASALETFKEAAVERNRLEAEANDLRARQQAERERQMAAEQAKAEELKGFVHDIEAGFERLAEGDLTVRMERPVAEE
ncbi:cache domain-containing protein, partial [Mangrovibrevibacter kandeliae]|uniref:cache domain-containing protein n=1 Tax=Mangrovibrevibacter kandeliae TaxID=2968473 RepID=UPI002118E733